MTMTSGTECLPAPQTTPRCFEDKTSAKNNSKNNVGQPLKFFPGNKTRQLAVSRPQDFPALHGLLVSHRKEHRQQHLQGPPFVENLRSAYHHPARQSSRQ